MGQDRKVHALFGWLAVALLAATAVLLGTRPASGDVHLSDEEVRRGGTLYAFACAACHGPTGAGGVGEGVMAGPELRGLDVALLDLVIRTGRMPLLEPRAGIVRDPALTAEDREQMVAWMADALDLEGEVPVVPEGDVARGKALYGSHCMACHGSTGRGGVAGGEAFVLPLRGLDRVAAVSAARVGPFGMPRFGAGVLDDEDLADIGAYVESFEREPRSPLGFADMGHVAGAVMAAVLAIAVLGCVALAARRPFPRRTAARPISKAATPSPDGPAGP